MESGYACMSDDIFRLLDDVKFLLRPDTTNYIRPQRDLICLSFLVPPGIEYDLRKLAHTYIGDENDIEDNFNFCTRNGFQVIRHGHKYNEPCATPFFCHIWGFIPEQSHNPNFRANFWAKWKPKEKPLQETSSLIIGDLKL